MPLSVGDIKRLRRLGYHLNEFVVARQGERRLRNIDGHCFFLVDGRCSVYFDRPAGCRLYPLVADWKGRIHIDAFCPHREKFDIIEGDATKLRKLLSKLKCEFRRELI
jgi:Fe-S-cluster containining protein